MIFLVLGILYYDLYDFYNVKIGENTYKCIMLNDEINITQGIEEIIHTEMPEQSETDYTKADKTDRRINQTYFIVDKQNQQIQSVITQIGDRSEKTTTITQDIEGINQKVEQAVDLTKTIQGIKSLTISDGYIGGYILEIHIYGNNTVFDYLYPADNLYPDNELYPYGDSKIRFYNSKEDRTIELGIDEVLRANEDVKDELIINNKEVYLIRRVNSDGTTKTQETKTFLGTLEFILEEGYNTFEIVNYTAQIEIKYVPENDYTKVFATKLEMNSEISQTEKNITTKVSETYETKENATTNYSQLQQTANSLQAQVNKNNTDIATLELTAEGLTSTVAKKVGENEVISKINQSSEAVTILANKLGLTANDVINLIAGNAINLSSKNISIASDNFNVNASGNMSCTNAHFTGGTIKLQSSSNTNNFIIGDDYNYNYDFTRMNGTNIEMYKSSKENQIMLGFSTSTQDLQNEGMLTVGGNGYFGQYGQSLANLTHGSSSTTIRANGITTPSLTQTSKEESKKNFEKLENGLDIIKATDIYKYNLKEQNDGEKKHIGFVIGENFKYSHDITAENNGEEVGVDTYSMVAVAYKAIQEQQEEIEQLKNKIKELEGK